MTFSSCFFHAAWWMAPVIDVFRRISSGSVSNADEPSSTRPIRLAAPAAKSSASATVVFPVPPCPTMATLRIFVGSSAGIAPSGVGARVAPVDEPEAVERQELVDGLDGRGGGRDQAREPPRRERPCFRVVLGSDALHDAVHQRRVAVNDAGLDRMDRVAADDPRRADELDRL